MYWTDVYWHFDTKSCDYPFYILQKAKRRKFVTFFSVKRNLPKPRRRNNLTGRVPVFQNQDRSRSLHMAGDVIPLSQIE